MFAGHIGVALAFGRAEPRVNIGLFIGAALLLDAVLWLLVLLGWESVVIGADFPRTHQPEFTFPYSHGLVASLAWSALAAAAFAATHARLGTARRRGAFLVAAAVFSHWLLDALVHRPELPLAGAESLKVGLGLWHSLPAALAVEATLVVAGLVLYLGGPALAGRRRFALTALTVLILVFTVLGMTVAPAPPSTTAMAASSLLTLIVVCALAWALGRRPSHGAARVPAGTSD